MSEQELRELFEKYGEVHAVKIITDKESGKSKGYGFVQMDKKFGLEAIDELNGKDINGRILKVNEAQEKKFDNNPSRNSRDYNRDNNKDYGNTRPKWQSDSTFESIHEDEE